MGHESKANSICLSKRFGRLTPSAVKSSFNFSAFHITFCHEFYLSISEHSKPISVDNLSQKPSDCRQAFEVCRDQENQPPQKSSFLNIFSPDQKPVLKPQSVHCQESLRRQYKARGSRHLNTRVCIRIYCPKRNRVHLTQQYFALSFSPHSAKTPCTQRAPASLQSNDSFLLYLTWSY